MTARPRLLIVDDEAAQMTALCDTLEDHGYGTTGFTSAKEALAVLRGQEFDLVLTDLMMPEMDGITLLRAALDMDANLVGIVMTGHGSIDTAVEAMKGGALDYILKPFKLSVIVPVLARAGRAAAAHGKRRAGTARSRTHRRARRGQPGTRGLLLLGLPRPARAPAPHRRVCGAARETSRAHPR
jgi:DNA-binding NtrC family response regulator